MKSWKDIVDLAVAEKRVKNNIKISLTVNQKVLNINHKVNAKGMG